MILIFLVLELIKRPRGWVLYPLAYALRYWSRTYKPHADTFYRERIYTAPRNPIKWFFWIWLDDSVQIEFGKEYCPKANKMSNWVEWLSEGAFKEFARSYYWSCWRNNAIDLSWALCFGQFTATIGQWWITRTIYYRILRHGNWALSQFQADCWGWRLQVGWLTNGKFEVEFRKTA